MDRSRSRAQNSGSAMAALLNPAPPPAPTRAFGSEHRTMLKQMQQRKEREAQEQLERAQAEPFKMNRFKDVTSVVQAEVMAPASSDTPTHSFLRKNTGKSVAAGNVTQEAQALEASRSGGTTLAPLRRASLPSSSSSHSQSSSSHHAREPSYSTVGPAARRASRDSSNFDYGSGSVEDMLYGQDENDAPPRFEQFEYDEHDANDDAVPYSHGAREYSVSKAKSASASPSASKSSTNASAARLRNSTKPAVPTRAELKNSVAPTRSNATPKSFIAANAMAAIHHTSARSAPTSKDGSPRLHEDFGHVPKYIHEIKHSFEEKKAEERRRKEEEKIPPGMKKLTEEERLEMKEKLETKRQEVLNELAAFPLRVETIHRKKKKDELDAKFKEIEDAISLFSRKVVYIAL